MVSITLKFLRVGVVVCAADEMRDNNDTPVRFLKSTNPDPHHDHLFVDSDMWDNFVHTKWRFFIHSRDWDWLGAWISPKPSSITSSSAPIGFLGRSENKKP